MVTNVTGNRLFCLRKSFQRVCGVAHSYLTFRKLNCCATPSPPRKLYTIMSHEGVTQIVAWVSVRPVCQLCEFTFDWHVTMEKNLPFAWILHSIQTRSPSESSSLQTRIDIKWVALVVNRYVSGLWKGKKVINDCKIRILLVPFGLGFFTDFLDHYASRKFQPVTRSQECTMIL